MNKKIMSFVLAMFLSVGLGVSNLYSGDNYNAHSGNGANNAVLQSSGTAASTNPSASSLTDRINQVFHYEDGILVSATGADGTITVYDQGQYRGTMTMGIDGSYTWSALAFYGSDYDVIAEVGLKQFLLNCGVKEEQLTGGGEEAFDLTLTSQAYDQLSDEDKALCEEASGTYYEYKTRENDQDVTKLLTEEEYKALSKEEKEKCTKYEGKVYTLKKPATEPQELGWLQRAQDHLSKGPNFSVQINFGASQGASVTLCVDGKGMETYAWNDALISYVEYNKNGYNTFTLQKGVDLKESVETGKPQTEDKWVCEVTVNGKVQGQYDVIPNENGNGFTLKQPSSVQYTYNADGTRASIYNVENGQTTYFSANKVMSITGPLKDKDGNTVTNEDGSPQIVTLQLYKYTDNGMYDTVTSFGNDGGVTTTVYFNNKAMGTYRGGPELAGLMRSQILNIWETAVSPTEYTGTYDIDSRLISVSWYPEQLKQIQANGEVGIKNFMKVSGLDYENADAYKSVVGGVDEDGVYQMGLIEKALKYTNWLSQSLSMTYYDTAYSQSELDTAEESASDSGNKSEDKDKVKPIPANKYVGNAVIFNKGTQFASYDFSNLDPSISRAYYIFFTDTFKTDSPEFKQMMEELGITLSETMSQREFEEAIDKIVDYLQKKVDEAIAKIGDSVGEGTTTADLSFIQNMFKDGMIGNFSVTFTVEHISTSANGGTNHTDAGTTTNNHRYSGTYETRTTNTSRSTSRSTSGSSGSDAAAALKNALSGLKTSIEKYFSSAMARIKSGNLDNLMDQISSDEKIHEGYSESFKQTITTTTTTTTTITTNTEIGTDPAVVGTVTGFYQDPETGQWYAILENAQINVGDGFENADGEIFYVAISDEMHNTLASEKENAEATGGSLTFAVAGYIGEVTDADGVTRKAIVGLTPTTEVYAWDFSTTESVESFVETFYETKLKDNEEFLNNMADNQAKFEEFAKAAGYASWDEFKKAAGTAGLTESWKAGWELLSNWDALKGVIDSGQTPQYKIENGNLTLLF